MGINDKAKTWEFDIFSSKISVRSPAMAGGFFFAETKTKTLFQGKCWIKVPATAL